jgi:hypothetical protein
MSSAVKSPELCLGLSALSATLSTVLSTPLVILIIHRGHRDRHCHHNPYLHHSTPSHHSITRLLLTTSLLPPSIRLTALCRSLFQSTGMTTSPPQSLVASTTFLSAASALSTAVISYRPSSSQQKNIVIAAAAISAPVAVTLAVSAAGFGVGGVAAGSVAAKWMALGGGVTPFLVPTLQSVGAAGMGTAATILTSLTGGAVAAVRTSHRSNL